LYLKSLTLRGFKSFASSTSLQLEPGITCVVGPNGSGKSNVVDALAWVMGEQGAKSLRGGKMEDVIFAGTSGRPPLGRAEVVLTIDNADGALPIEYSEVTISRTMFRNGGSEYAINGSSCRLLDVQELLSDSGIGREMHVIVGQGQLDAILRATPEERRGFVEEAAGVLKHRKRKEKALRKLETTRANVQRLSDLLSEIRRQLKPLGRQAEVAKRATVIQADLRDARARLLADDVSAARTTLRSELADETALRDKRAAVETSIATVRGREAAVEERLRADAPRMSTAQETWYRLAGLRERLCSTASLATERVRFAESAPHDERLGRDPGELENEAAGLAGQEAATAAEVTQTRQRLETAIASRQDAETAYSEEERRVAGLVRAAADRREGLARLRGQVNVVKSRARAAEEELGRLGEARARAQERAVKARRDFTALETQVASLDAGEGGLDTEHEAAQSTLDEVTARLLKAGEESRVSDRERAGLVARKGALEMSLDRKDGAGALLAATERVDGLLGSVAALLTVRKGYETAVARALGAAADAVAVDNLDTAVEAMRRLREQDLGRAGMVLGDTERDDTGWPELPPALIYAVDLVEVPAHLRSALRRLLFKVAVAPDLDTARRLVAQDADLVAVTRDGDMVGAHFASGGSSAVPSLIEVQSAVDQAAADLADASHEVERLAFEVARLTEEQRDAQGRVDAALSRLHESDAVMAAIAENLGQLGSASRSATGEAERLATAISDAEAARDKDIAGLTDLEDRLLQAEHAPEDDPDTTTLEALADAAKHARQQETDARLALRTAEERVRAISGRADALLKAAEDERVARERAALRRERRRRDAEVATAVIAASVVVIAHLDRSLERAGRERTEIEHGRSEAERELADLRGQLRDLGAELDRLIDSVHRDELARAEQRLRVETLEQRALEELGLDADALVTEYGPDVLVPAHGVAGGDDGDRDTSTPVPYVRAEQTKRRVSAERALTMLGRVNPLALEEFSALEERHQFLSEQMEDLRRTRKDLLDIVDDVDAQVEQVFTEAWADTEREFADVFSRLFPGGQGSLVLTDPSNMLTTGIDVEARPPGKKVKRLSLLSGGERSLVAVAFLVALFKARPSPFYVLDEVEAALDDTNLGRLLQIYEELRENSQLVVITHQKRTMEVADALYGVSMRGDGVSAVISQRMRESEASHH